MTKKKPETCPLFDEANWRTFEPHECDPSWSYHDIRMHGPEPWHWWYWHPDDPIREDRWYIVRRTVDEQQQPRNNMNYWQAQIEAWADDRGILNNSVPKDQFLKLVEEVGELGKSIRKGDGDGMMDDIGDATVVLTIIAAQMGTTLEACQQVAWEQIKGRTGRMIDGVFVKDD